MQIAGLPQFHTLGNNGIPISQHYFSNMDASNMHTMPSSMVSPKMRHSGMSHKKPTGRQRLRTPYIRFCMEQRPLIKEKNPDLVFGDIGRELGKLWQTLPTEERAKYLAAQPDEIQELTEQRVIRKAEKRKSHMKAQDELATKLFMLQAKQKDAMTKESLNASNAALHLSNQMPTQFLCSQGMLPFSQHKSAFGGMMVQGQQSADCHPNGGNGGHKKPKASRAYHGSNNDNMLLKQNGKANKDMTGKPKRLPTSFIVFAKEQRRHVIEQFPSATFSEIGKILGLLWAQLDKETKAQYVLRVDTPNDQPTEGNEM
jgi:hypothetical protein